MLHDFIYTYFTPIIEADMFHFVSNLCTEGEALHIDVLMYHHGDTMVKQILYYHDDPVHLCMYDVLLCMHHIYWLF